VLELKAPTDEQLVAAYRRGDDAAFTAIFERHRPVLLRYARKVLGSSSEHAEDVVQEAMWRAARALRRDHRDMNLRPWLFRLTRNCALDELARVRTDSTARTDLDLLEAAGALRASDVLEPEVAAERRRVTHDLLGDLAGLPEVQRHALLRREVDGVAHAQLAVELGVSEQASKNLVFRARKNLIKAREARTEACEEVQGALLTAHDRHRRAGAPVYRHLTSCADCRAFRTGLRSSRRTMAVLAPGPLLLVAAGGVGFAGWKTAGSAAAATTKGVAVKAGAVAATGALAFGAVEVHRSGDPAPQRLDSPSLRAAVPAGRPIPPGSAVVRQELTLAAGTTRPVVTLRCPPGTRVADLLPARGPAVAEYTPATTIGTSTVARVQLTTDPLGRPAKATVAVLCKRPDGQGSVLADPDFAGGGGAGARAAGIARANAVVTAATAFLLDAPRGAVVSSVRRDQPVRVETARGGWARVVTDAGERGWVPAGAVERR
jgi:RNA polymerase sigma factor (sigma-70 family)